MITSLRCGLAAALLCLPLAAQQTSTDRDLALRFVPADAGMVLRVQGPGRFFETFAGTNLGRMLSSDAFASLWQNLQEEMGAAEAFERVREESGVDLAAMLEAMGDYSGTLVVAVRMPSTSPALLDRIADEMSSGASPFGSDDGAGVQMMAQSLITVSMTPDGATDLDGMVEQLLDRFREEMASDSAVQLIDVPVGSAVGLGMESPEIEGFQMLMPTVVDGQVVMAMGGDLEVTLGDMLGADVGYELPEDAVDAGMSVDVSARMLDPLIGITGAVMAANGDELPFDGDASDMVDLLRTTLRLDGIRGMQMRVRPAEEHVMLDWNVHSDTQQSSLIWDLMRPDLDRLSLLNLVPREHTEFNSVAIDLGVIMDVVGDIMGELGAGDLEMVEEQFREETGYDLRADLLDRLDGQVVFCNDASSSGEEVAFGPPSLSFAIGLSDSAGMEEMIMTLMREGGAQPMLKEADYRGQRVRTLNAGIVALDFAFLDGGMLLGVGREGSANLRAMIDRNLAGDGADAEWPEPVQSRLDLLEPGWRGLSVSTSSMDTDVDELVDGLEMELDLPAPAANALAGLLRLMQDYDLMSTVGTTYLRDGQLRTRVIW